MNLIPDGIYKKVTDIDPGLLASQGVRLLIADLDNTLAGYSEWEPSPEMRAWYHRLLSAGIKMYILTNNRRRRGSAWCEALGAPYRASAGKPRPGGFLEALRHSGASPHEALVVGDQIFTDVLGARRAGLKVILVTPIELKNPLRAIRFALERPFRRSRRK